MGRTLPAVPAVGQLLVRPGSARLRNALQGAGLERGDGQKVGLEGAVGIRPPHPSPAGVGPPTLERGH